ncbi:hypothetical protein CTEN210_12020 [Chaetoceros tenuissimus]|uniref:Uncharacterized protein n=1 Tax=Chaetoceros tenuissimus TaxID=426638 RepID=A0AAD3D3R7_9STRA|nr:hypothetical protein CTEN210_12020 [Chaetoceros tenuissimus]
MVASSKLLTLFIIPMVTGTISIVSSSSLMFCILVYSQIKLKRVVRRILFMFCIYDCIYSLGSALSIFLTPEWTSKYALGNLITCDIQGAMVQIGFAGSAFYTLSLAIYYVAIIKFNRKEKDISNKLFEYILHSIPNSFAIISGIFLAVKRQYGPLAENHACWLGIHPRNCLTDPDVECERGSHMTIIEYAKWVFVIPFMLIYFLVFCTMMIACHHVIIQKRKADKWRMQTAGRDLSKSSFCCFVQRKKSGTLQEFIQEPVSSLSPAQTKFMRMQQALSKKSIASGEENTCILFGASTSRSGTKQDPLAFNVHQVKKKIRRESMLDHDAPIVLSSFNSDDRPLRSSRKSSRRREMASRDEKIAITQCILYISSFLLCWIFALIARIYGITGNPAPFEVVLLSRIFNPLQGFFFILVYSRPHVKAIQKSDPELKWFQAFVIAFKAGGDNDFGGNQLEVVDENGIDVPRLRDSERERRQEIVRQQYKRRSVSYRSTYNSRSYSNIEGKESDMSEIDFAVVDGTTIKEFELELAHVAKNDTDVEAIMLPKKDKDKIDDIVV